MSDGRRELDRRSFIARGAASGLALGMGAGSGAAEVAEGEVAEGAGQEAGRRKWRSHRPDNPVSMFLKVYHQENVCATFQCRKCL